MRGGFMDVISTTISYQGNPIKIENGKVYALGFGTTITNRTMHHSWIEIKKDDMRKEFRQYLEQNKLI